MKVLGIISTMIYGLLAFINRKSILTVILLNLVAAMIAIAATESLLIMAMYMVTMNLVFLVGNKFVSAGLLTGYTGLSVVVLNMIQRRLDIFDIMLYGFGLYEIAISVILIAMSFVLIRKCKKDSVEEEAERPVRRKRGLGAHVIISYVLIAIGLVTIFLIY